MADAGDEVTMAKLLRQPNGLPDLSQTPAFGSKGFGGGVREFYPELAMEAAPLVAGPVGKAGSAVASAMRAYPKMSAVLMGMLGLGAGAKDAEDSTLTKRQKRQLEIKEQEQKQALEAERVRSEIESRAQKQAAEQGLALEMARKQQEDAFAREQAAREAVKPFRERHPELNAAIPYLAAGTAATLPFLMRGGQTLAQTLRVPAWRAAIADTKAAAEAGDVAKATTGARELAQRNAAHDAQGGAKGLGKGALAAGGGGVAGTEVSMIPAQSDWYSLPAGNPDREAGKAQATDPIEIAKRMTVLSLLGGTGYKTGGIIPGRTAPIEESRSMAGILKEGFADEAATVARNIAAMRGQSALPPQAATRLEPLPSTSIASGSEVLGTLPRSTSATALPSGQGQGQQSLASVLRGEGRSSAPAASQSKPSPSPPANQNKEPHWIKQNRDKGKFAEGFKDEDGK